MKQKLINILSNMKRYNASNLAELTFGLDTNVEYDALVVAICLTICSFVEN